MPPEAVKVVMSPRISDEELDTFTEDSAIQILLKQGDSEEAILQYLARRKPQDEGE